MGHTAPTPRPSARAGAPSAPEVFVGRAVELEQLLGLFARASDGHGQLAWICGEAGLGKSALVRRFLAALAERGHTPRIATGHCCELHGPSDPYAPFLEALAGLLAGPHGASLEAQLEVQAPGWCTQFPELFANGRRGPAPPVESAEGLQRQLVQALGAWAAAQPVVLVLEDLHWADASSLELLRLWGERCRGQRLLVIASYRPEAPALDAGSAQPQTGAPCLRALLTERGLALPRLAPFALAELASYLDSCFPCNTFPPSLAELALRATGGLPLLAARWAQTLREQGRIEARPEGLALTCEPAELEGGAPDDLSSLIRQRLAHLPTTTRQTLGFASIEGEAFRTCVLAEALGRSVPDVQRELAEIAQRYGLLVAAEEERFPDGDSTGRNRFSHVLFRSLLYEELSSQRRIALHRRAAQTLEAHGCGRSGRFLAQLALHHERGRSFTRAVPALIEAGDRATRILAPHEALRCYARARALLSKLPEGERLVCSLSLQHAQGWLEFRRGSFPTALAHFEALSDRAQTATLRGEALSCQCQVLCGSGRWDELVERARELQALAQQQANGPRHAEALAYLAAAALGNAQLPSAQVLLDECSALARLLGHERALLLALPRRAWLHAHHGELRAAESLYREVLEHAQGGWRAAEYTSALADLAAREGQLDRALALHGEVPKALYWVCADSPPSLAGWLLRELGDLAAAAQSDREALRALRRRGPSELGLRLACQLAQSQTRLGDPAAAEATLRAAEPTIAAVPIQCSWWHGIFWQAEAELALARRDFDHAAELAERSARLAQSERAPESAARAECLLAECALARADHGAARAHAEAALEQLAATPTPLGTWQVHALLARVAARAGDMASELAARARARALVLQLAARLHDPSLRASFRAEVARQLGTARDAAAHPRESRDATAGVREDSATFTAPTR